MSEPRLSTRRELELMQRLQQLADSRAQEERILAAAIASEMASAEKEFEETSRQLNEEHATRRRQLENEFAEAKSAAASAFEAAQRKAEAAQQAALKANE